MVTVIQREVQPDGQNGTPMGSLTTCKMYSWIKAKYTSSNVRFVKQHERCPKLERRFFQVISTKVKLCFSNIVPVLHTAKHEHKSQIEGLTFVLMKYLRH